MCTPKVRFLTMRMTLTIAQIVRVDARYSLSSARK